MSGVGRHVKFTAQRRPRGDVSTTRINRASGPAMDQVIKAAGG